MRMKITLGELAEKLGATLHGDPTIVLTGVAPIHLAGPEELTYLADPKKVKILDTCRAAAVLIPSGAEEVITDRPVLTVADVDRQFDAAAALFREPRTALVRDISPLAVIDQRARLGAKVRVGANAFIGADVEIGDDSVIFPGAVILDGTVIGKGTTIFPNVTIYENCVVGDRCLIHAGAVIGAYGFGYDSSTGVHRLSAQLGNVVLEDDVEIGANSTIDRATHGSTIIGLGTKIDNLVMIAHNCRLGKFNLICAHTGVAGSTTTGDYVVMAGRVGVRDHVHIGTGAVLGAMAGIMTDIPPKANMVGIPATDVREQMKKQVALAKLPEMRRQFNALQAEVGRLAKEWDRLSGGSTK